MIHDKKHETFIILVLFTVPFYHFLSSRYVDLAELTFCLDALIPFPDSGVLYSRGHGNDQTVAG